MDGKRGTGDSVRGSLSRRAGEDRGFGGGDRLGRADMHPHALQPQAVKPAGLDGAIEQEVEREGARRRIGHFATSEAAIVAARKLAHAAVDDGHQAEILIQGPAGELEPVAFTALALLVACLGLFGLVTFAAEQRNKEMSIRKVLTAWTWPRPLAASTVSVPPR